MVRCLRFIQLQGSVSNLPRWIQLEWTRTKAVAGVGSDHSITWTELLPILLYCVVSGAALRRQRVTVYCDNSGAVVVVNSGFSRVHSIMHLLRCLFFIRAHYELWCTLCTWRV